MGQKDPNYISKKDIEKLQARSAVKEGAKQLGSKYLQAHGVPAPLANMAVNKIAKNRLVNKELNRASDRVAKNPFTRRNLSKIAPLLGAGKNQKKSKNNGLGSIGETGNDDNGGAPENTDVNLKAKFNLLDLKNIKIKLIIFGIIFLILIVFIVMISTLISLGVIETDNDDGSTTYNGSPSYGNSSAYWWPIGSAEATNVNGILFAAGTPVTTVNSCGYKNCISSPYGNRDIGIGSRNHKGIDITMSGINGKYVIASKSGKVDVAGYNVVRGYNVLIQHDDGNLTRYNHLLSGSITVKKGDRVEQGQVIGKVGSTGTSTGPHLHFEVHINGERVNPELYVSVTDPRPGYHDLETPSNDIISGDSNKQTVCMTMKSFGYSNNAVASIMTNIQYESNFNELAVNELGCIGITQWCFGRMRNLKNTYGEGWKDIKNQLKFLDYELSSSSYNYIKNYINKGSSVSDSTYYYCMHFEVPGKEYCVTRRDSQYNSIYYNYVNNNCQ